MSQIQGALPVGEILPGGVSRISGFRSGEVSLPPKSCHWPTSLSHCPTLGPSSFLITTLVIGFLIAKG